MNSWPPDANFKLVLVVLSEIGMHGFSRQLIVKPQRALYTWKSSGLALEEIVSVIFEELGEQLHAELIARSHKVNNEVMNCNSPSLIRQVPSKENRHHLKFHPDE